MIHLHRSCVAFTLSLLASAICALPSHATEVVPGKSVGKIELGMSQQEVRSALGKPDYENGPEWKYGRDVTNFMFVHFNPLVHFMTFVGPEYLAPDSITTMNAMSEAPDKGYVHWELADTGLEAWVHPEGGLLFRPHTRQDDVVIVGYVYPKGLSMNDLFEESGWAIKGVEDITSASMQLPNNSSLSWEGKYGLSEKVTGRPPWDYVLDVHCANGDECAELRVDGPQMGVRIVCTTETLDNSLLIRFLKDGPDNQFASNYKKGEILFTLTRDDKGTIATTWKAMKPLTDAENGSLNFLQIEGDTTQKRIEKVADQVIAELIRESAQDHELSSPEIDATPQNSQNTETPYVDEAPGQSSSIAPEEPAPQRTQDIGVYLIILLLVLLAVVFIFWLSKLIANIIILAGCAIAAGAVYTNRFMFDDILQTLGAAVAVGLLTGFLLLPLLPYSSFAVLLKSRSAQQAPPKENAQAE